MIMIFIVKNYSSVAARPRPIIQWALHCSLHCCATNVSNGRPIGYR